jgi:hypothetical protein
MKLKRIPFIVLLMFVAFQSCTVENPYAPITDQPTPTPTPTPVVPTVTVPANITVVKGIAVSATNFVSTPTGATFAWTNSNTSIGLAASGSGDIPSFIATNTGTTAIVATIIVVPTLNGTAGTPSSYTITVTPSTPTSTTPTVTVPANITVTDKGTVAVTSFTSTPAGGTFTWTNSNTAIGLAASGTGNVPQFTATNTGTTTITATITVTPTVNSVKGTPSSYTITVNPTPPVSNAITLTGSSSGSSASHNAGQNCMSCHTPGTSAGNKGVWTVAGTVYTSSAGATIAKNLVVNFYTGPNGTGTLKYTMTANAKGNFYSANTVNFTGGLYPAVVGPTTTKYMGSSVTSPSSCNSCHTGGTGTARVWAN